MLKARSWDDGRFGERYTCNTYVCLPTQVGELNQPLVLASCHMIKYCGGGCSTRDSRRVFQSRRGLAVFPAQVPILHHSNTRKSLSGDIETDTMATTNDAMIQTGIFEDLQKKIDEDTAVKDVS